MVIKITNVKAMHNSKFKNADTQMLQNILVDEISNVFRKLNLTGNVKQ